MQRKYWLSAIGLILLGLIIGKLTFGASGQDSGYIPPLNVIGDVARVVKLEDPKQLGKLQEINFDGHKYQALKLTDIIEAAQPWGMPEQIYLISQDGFASSFPALGLEESYIAFTAENGWEAINFNHPINSNAKMLKEIVVVSGESAFDLAVIDSEKELARVTPGQLYTHALLDYPYPEGQAEIKNQGETYNSSVYTQRKVFRLNDLTPVQEGAMMLLIGANGENRYQENRGYFELKENHINYLNPEERTQLEEIKGIIVNPPSTSITDIYYDTRHYLENGQKVLVVIGDGLTYSRYTQALEKGRLSFLENAAPAVKAVGVYPQEKNTWLATMITGKTPKETGVISPKDLNLQEPSLFAMAEQLHKSALLLHSGPKLLNTEIEPQLVNDENADKTADDELYNLTLDKLEQGYDFIVLGFDDLTDSKTDAYLREIVKRWPGKVIITGIPENTEQEISCDSMFVPYLCLD